MFEYYNGRYISYHDGGLNTDTTFENGKITKIFLAPYDIASEEGKYRIAMLDVARDPENPKNQGIHSLYIIRFDEDSHSWHTYRGDEKYTPGIHIGVTCSKEVYWSPA